jgi:predicted nucleotidyltransferase
MRLTTADCQNIKQAVRELAGEDANVRLFGSRTDERLRGGDIDLYVEVKSREISNPAWLASRISARVSRRIGHRSVDVLLAAPNLKRLPIHDHAAQTGILL